DLIEIMVRSLVQREFPEQGNRGPWLLGPDAVLRIWRSKLGLKVVDERITISHDPSDPELGIVMRLAERPEPVAWIERGVLTNLGHEFSTDVRRLEGAHHLRGATGYRMSGGDTTLEEMIRTTRR